MELPRVNQALTKRFYWFDSWLILGQGLTKDFKIVVVAACMALSMKYNPLLTGITCHSPTC